MSKNIDVGILILRVGLGITFFMHGLPKITGGVATWKNLGSSIAIFGITKFPAIWGFTASVIEFAGAIFLILGLFTRYAAFFMFLVMLVATSMHISKGHGFMTSSHAIELAVVFLSLVFIGAGKYSVDK